MKPAWPTGKTLADSGTGKLGGCLESMLKEKFSNQISSGWNAQSPTNEDPG